jgi:hypothetical protein
MDHGILEIIQLAVRPEPVEGGVAHYAAVSEIRGGLVPLSIAVFSTLDPEGIREGVKTAFQRKDAAYAKRRNFPTKEQTSVRLTESTYFFLRAFRIRSGVMGKRISLAPVAL